MKYFAYISHQLSLKNNLDKEALELLMEHNRTIIDGKDLEWFKNGINKSIEKLNARHPRCKSLKPDWWQPGWSSQERKDWTLNNIGSCTFNLYATKE